MNTTLPVVLNTNIDSQKFAAFIEVDFPTGTDDDFVTDLADDIDEDLIGYDVGRVLREPNEVLVETAGQIAFKVGVSNGQRELAEALKIIVQKLNQRHALQLARITKPPASPRGNDSVE